MLIYKKGDLLQAKENLICHQVNENGVMGGGLALQIATQYPKIEREYKILCEEYHRKNKDICGQWQICQANKEIFIINCFTQQNFNTRYDLIEKVFNKIKNYAKQRDLSIAIPFNMGCGISNGDWNKVVEILEKIFIDTDLVIYRKEIINENKKAKR